MPKINSSNQSIVGLNKFGSSNRKPAKPIQSRVCQPSTVVPTKPSLFNTLNTQHGSFHFGCFSDSTHYLEYKFMKIVIGSLKNQLIQDLNFEFNTSKINNMILQGIHDFKKEYPFDNYKPKTSFSMIYIDNYKTCHVILMGDAMITLTSSDQQKIYSGLSTSVTLDEFLDHFLDSSIESNIKKLLPKKSYLTITSVEFEAFEFKLNDGDTIRPLRISERGALERACYDHWYIKFQSWTKILKKRAKDHTEPEFTLNDFRTFQEKGARYFEQMVRSFFPNLKETIGPSYNRHGQYLGDKQGANFEFPALLNSPAGMARSSMTLSLNHQLQHLKITKADSTK